LTLLLYQPIEGHFTRQGAVLEWLLQFSSTGFSLWPFGLARTNPLRLKPMLLNPTLTAQVANDILQ